MAVVTPVQMLCPSKVKQMYYNPVADPEGHGVDASLYGSPFGKFDLVAGEARAVAFTAVAQQVFVAGEEIVVVDKCFLQL